MIEAAYMGKIAAMRVPLFGLAMVCALALSSCMEFGSEISVNKDGSGVIEETMLMGPQLAAMLQGLAGAEADPDNPNPAAGLAGLLVDEKKAAENAKKYGEGVTVQSLEKVALPDGRSGSKVKYAFTDITKVTYQPGDSDAAAQLGAGEVKEKPMTFGFANGELTINIPRDEAEGAGAEKVDPEDAAALEEMDPTEMAMIKAMFTGMRFYMRVKAAGGIASSDATHVDANTVTLMDMQIDKLFSSPENMKKISALMNMEGEPSPEKLAKDLKGVEGIKIEEKKKISVKLK